MSLRVTGAGGGQEGDGRGDPWACPFAPARVYLFEFMLPWYCCVIDTCRVIPRRGKLLGWVAWRALFSLLSFEGSEWLLLGNFNNLVSGRARSMFFDTIILRKFLTKQFCCPVWFFSKVLTNQKLPMAALGKRIYENDDRDLLWFFMNLFF